VKIALFLDDIEFLKNLEGFSIVEFAAIYAYYPLVDVAGVIFILIYIVGKNIYIYRHVYKKGYRN